MARRSTSDTSPLLADGSEKVTLRLPAKHLRMLDFLVELHDYPTRSEAIRAAVRDMVYARVELVHEKAKKMQDAESTLSSLESLKKNYVHR